MNLDRSIFTVHDIHRFPAIVVRPERVQPGYAVQWEKEMDALIEYGHAFIVIYLETPHEETHDDFRQRGLWLKKNKHALANLCKALVTVEADDARREAARIRGLGATKAFGVPHHAVATAQQAFQLITPGVTGSLQVF
jgi:hypothetical protein